LDKYYNIFINLRIIRAFVSFSKRWKPRAFDGAPVYDVGNLFFSGIYNGDLTARASSVAFNFFLALFPGIIFLFTLIPYVPVDNFQNQLLEMLGNILPHNAYEATRSTLEDIIKHQRGGLLSLGFVLALYFSTSGINSMMDAFNECIHVVETRSAVKQRVISLFLTIIITILLVFSTILLIFSETVISYLLKLGILKDVFMYYLILIGRWVVVIGMFLIGISILYFFAPAKRKGKRIITTGAVVATVLSLLTSMGFAYFVNNFGKYNKLYGSIGTLIVILLWIYFNSLILLIGFELNASITIAKKHMKKPAMKNMLRP
jgi:membrane protein